MGAVFMSKKENRQAKNLLPLWSPYDISREDSWELIFPWGLRIPFEDGGDPVGRMRSEEG